MPARVSDGPAGLTFGSGAWGIWTTSLGASPAERSLLTDLAAGEVSRAARFHRPPDRERFVVGRSGIRRLLGRVVGRPPASLRFAYGPFGKPSLARAPGDPDVRFNVSHSGELVVWILGLGVDVGVDVEQIRTDTDGIDSDLVRASLSAAESRRFAELAEAEVPGAFLTCWTAKEAYTKALGAGLSIDFRDLDVFESLERTGRAAVRDPNGGTTVALRSLPAPPGYRTACAVAAPYSPLSHPAVTPSPFTWL